MIQSVRPHFEEGVSTKGDGEPKNLNEVNFKQNKEQLLKEMIFTSNVSEFDKLSGR